MRAGGEPRRTIEVASDGSSVDVIDQTKLPRSLEVARLTTLDDACRAIRDMIVRGAPLIGVTAAYGLCLALRDGASDEAIVRASTALAATRPTAVNLRWAIERMERVLAGVPISARVDAGFVEAAKIADEDVAACRAIGEHGADLLERVYVERGKPERLEIVTHCNAGWLATVDWGTALAPVYVLARRGIPVHVWVSETRPRNQGLLTEWELREEGVPATLVVDNAGGHLLATGRAHACIVGSDRTTRRGDVCNKIGTYLKALAARAANVPFFAAVPGSTIDFAIDDARQIPIEERSSSEITDRDEIAVFNPAFDVTPAELVTAIVTERGVANAEPSSLARLYPERAGH